MAHGNWGCRIVVISWTPCADSRMANAIFPHLNLIKGKPVCDSRSHLRQWNQSGTFILPRILDEFEQIELKLIAERLKYFYNCSHPSMTTENKYHRLHENSFIAKSSLNAKSYCFKTDCNTRVLCSGIRWLDLKTTVFTFKSIAYNSRERLNRLITCFRRKTIFQPFRKQSMFAKLNSRMFSLSIKMRQNHESIWISLL